MLCLSSLAHKKGWLLQMPWFKRFPKATLSIQMIYTMEYVPWCKRKQAMSLSLVCAIWGVLLIRSLFPWHRIFNQWGAKSLPVNMTDTAKIRAALTTAFQDSETVRVLVWMESPSNPMLNVTDFKHVLEMATSMSQVVGKNVLTLVDTTWSTPYLTRPLDIGKEWVIKYIKGQDREGSPLPPPFLTTYLLTVAHSRALGQPYHPIYLLSNTTFSSPYPFTGIDFVLHSCTKYLGGKKVECRIRHSFILWLCGLCSPLFLSVLSLLGHSDLLGGIVTSKKTKAGVKEGEMIELMAPIRHVQQTAGAVMSPMEAWLVLRGLRSLAPR